MGWVLNLGHSVPLTSLPFPPKTFMSSLHIRFPWRSCLEGSDLENNLYYKTKGKLVGFIYGQRMKMRDRLGLEKPPKGDSDW